MVEGKGRKSMMFKNSKKNGSGAVRLDRLVSAARENARAPQTLSSQVRASILERAQREQAAATAPLPALFTPTRRLLVAGALPLLLAGALFVMVDPAVETEGETLRVSAMKQGDQVLFTIANGSEGHTVYRSTSPDRFEPGSAVRVTDGAYTDTVDDQADLVFYRID